MTEELIPLLNFQKQFWDAERAGFLNHTALHSEILFRCGGHIGQDRIESIIQSICQDHAVLNSRVTNFGGRDFLEPKGGIEGVEIVQLHPSDSPTEDAIWKLLRYQFRKPFDLINTAPIRFVYLTINSDEYIFGAILHHLIYDSTTLEILSGQIERHLNGEGGGRNSHSIPFTQYTKEREKSYSDEYTEYWKTRIANMGSGGKFRSIYKDIPSLVSRSFSLADGKIDDINALKETGYTANIVFISAVVFSLRCISGEKSMMVEAVSSDRQSSDTAETVGCLLDIFPVVVDIPQDIEFVGLLGLVRKEFLRCFSKRPGYFLQELSRLGYRMGSSPQINWAHRPNHSSKTADPRSAIAKRIKFGSIDGDIVSNVDESTSLPLALFAEMIEDRITVELISAWLAPETVDRFIDNLNVFFDGIIDRPTEKCFAN